MELKEIHEELEAKAAYARGENELIDKLAKREFLQQLRDAARWWTEYGYLQDDWENTYARLVEIVDYLDAMFARSEVIGDANTKTEVG